MRSAFAAATAAGGAGAASQPTTCSFCSAESMEPCAFMIPSVRAKWIWLAGSWWRLARFGARSCSALL